MSLVPVTIPAVTGFPIEHVESLGKLAVESLNAVLTVHHAAWLMPDAKPLIPVTEQGAALHIDSIREAVERLAALSARLPDFPFDDPFTGGDSVEMGGVVATSAHAACLLMARRCNDLVRLACFGFDVRGASSGLLATDQSDVLSNLTAVGCVSERGVDWGNVHEVERVTRFLRRLFVGHAPTGLTEWEAFRFAHVLCEQFGAELACERVGARGRAVTHTAPEPVPADERRAPASDLLPPKWIRTHLTQKQFRLLCLLWEAGRYKAGVFNDVSADQLLKALGYRGSQADTLLRLKTRTSAGLQEKAKDIGGSWCIGQRDRDGKRFYYLEELSRTN